MLDALVLLATAAFIAAGAAIGFRLLALARRSRELSDFLVGFSLFVLACLAYPLGLVSAFVELPLAAAKWVSLIGSICAGVGWGCVFLFTQRVFRSSERWARGLAWTAAAAIAVLLVDGARFVAGAPDAAALASPSNPTFWLTAAAIVVYCWTSFEGFRCWIQARRRMKLGLADPLVANRFLMWACVGASALISVGPSFVVVLMGGDGTDIGSRLSAAVGGLGAAIALQLGFLPPAAYRRWLGRSAAA